MESMNEVMEVAPVNMHQEAYQDVAKRYAESVHVTKAEVLSNGYSH